MKVFLIHPPPNKGCRVVRQGRCLAVARPNVRMEFPIFLAYVAAVLREAGHSVSVVDAMAEDLSLDSIKKRMLRFAPDAVMVETVPITFQGDIRIADIAKQVDEEIKTIYYGWHAAARPRGVLSFQNVDFVVRGEPEYTSLELVNRLEEGGDLRDVKGLSFKANSVVKQNPPRPFVEHLDQLPHPARDLFPLEKYVAEPLGKMTTVIASRGCPYSCIYCSSHLMDGSKFRSRSPKNVVDEIGSVVNRFNIRTIFFYADTFTLWNDRNIMEFCRELLTRKLDVRWLINSRVDTLPSENTLKYMAKSGCFLIQFGVESGSPRMVKAMRKGRNMRECETYMKAIKPAIEKTKKAGIFTKINMIIGFEGENEETVRESVNLVKELQPDYPVAFNIVFPFPGTALAKIAERRGLFPSNEEEWSGSELRKARLQLYAAINNASPDKIVRLQEMANEAVKFPLTKKLNLMIKLLRRAGFGILPNMIKLATKEGTDVPI